MLTSKETTKHLGNLVFGKPFEFKFPVKNEGESGVTITSVSAGCNSCTKANASRMFVRPGEEININVQFTPGSLGPQKKKVYVRWNKTEVLNLEFTAESYEQS